jgi:DNA-binding MarR family transcriptional regulator
MVSMKTKSEAVAEIGELLGALAEVRDEGDDERDYLAQSAPGHLEAVIRDLPTLSIHLLAAIGEGATNIVGLAARSGQLKGTVSKHVQRLVEAGLVERSGVAGNRKEVHLELTEDGQALDRVHRRMHERKRDALAEFLLRYTAAELQTLTTVLGDLVAAGPAVLRPLTGTGR